ncbi:MAG: allene oxide cyclase family protein [Dongiaceae bacterium]
MRTTTTVITAGAAALLLGLAAAGAAADEGRRFTVVERAVSDTVTDTGAKGDSVGDLLTFANQLYDEANATAVGSDNGWCIRTVVGKAWECTTTIMLPDGQIAIAGPYLDGRDSTMAVTGGTGRYGRARGEMKLHWRDAQGTAFDFVFALED